jgi:hypothetical protein
MKNAVFAILVAGWASGAFASAPLDVSGVSLGMSSEEAQAAVKKANPKYMVTALKNRAGKTVGWIGATPSPPSRPGYSADHLVAVTDSAAGTWFVSRTQAFEKGERSDSVRLVAALKEKFGKPSNEAPGYLDWQFDRTGGLFAGGDRDLNRRVPISPLCKLHDPQRDDPGQAFSLEWGIPQQFMSRCGSWIQVFILTDVFDHLVTSFSINITNSSTKFDEADAKSRHEGAERKRALDQEKANSRVPKF